MMDVEDIMATICAKWSVSEFVERMEITIEEITWAFQDKIAEMQHVLPYDLEMEQEPQEYDDR